MGLNWYADERAVRRAVAEGRHRDAIGGLWEEHGQLQLDFLVTRGLTPFQTLLDIGCGSGRLAVKAVPYLAAHRYFGLDISPSLLDAARRELDNLGLLNRLAPHALTATADFRAHPTTPPVDVAIAQSVFTHLPLASFADCLSALAPRLARAGTFYATFFVAPHGAGPTVQQPGGIISCPDCDPFHFSIESILSAARGAGWSATWIGDWQHPRGQQMGAFRLGP